MIGCIWRSQPMWCTSGFKPCSPTYIFVAVLQIFQSPQGRILSIWATLAASLLRWAMRDLTPYLQQSDVHSHRGSETDHIPLWLVNKETDKRSFCSQIPSHCQWTCITHRWVRERLLQSSGWRRVWAEYSPLLSAQLLKFISTVQTKCLKHVKIYAGITALSVLWNFSDWILSSSQRPGNWGNRVWHTPHISQAHSLGWPVRAVEVYSSKCPHRQQKLGA